MAATLAAEASCRPADLSAGEVRLFELAPGWRDEPLRRRFRLPDDSLAITTMGSGVIVSATARWMGWTADLFRGAEPDDHAAVVVYDEFGGTRMVRTKRWKYIHRYDFGPCELFDLREDPGERSNLLYHPDQQARIVSMRRMLEDFFQTYAEEQFDGRDLLVRGFGQGADLTGDLEADRAVFFQDWADPNPGPVLASLREQGR